uniref:Transmembrane protein 107 n=1 Tax=Geotrypetes seraphini TaxID=260995 RepID=A0A6P8PBV3_GEOSA|nr:transmembrane protein 107 isoform X4 [Geotrypetes seraphini]XP_033781285.1 transmembrane protein 107 isoform X4 [Geotrypetes seraphini]XP_033781286.1 transmembrane protein 107 isoform X4 [Geotrypetes seraphini]
MPVVNSLVPSRFLTLIAHLVIVITIFWSRVLPVHPSKIMIVALSVTLGLFAVELVGFLSGVSMFNNAQSLLYPAALCAHCSASICLSFFVFQKWECFTYWYILGFCSALPACIEIILFIAVFGLKKKPL